MSRTNYLFITLLSLLTQCAQSQNHQAPYLVGSCEGCEAILEYGDRKLDAVDTLPDFSGEGTRLKVTGTVYQGDGKTPAADVILYVYHTNQDGIYAPAADAEGWARRHGAIRGWMKTNARGEYTFYTLRPGAYPNGAEPEHIHITILEPDGAYYWLGSYHFADDPLLTERERNPRTPRGGSSGLLHLRRVGDLMIGHRDIVLGKNVPE